jgi:hypothetical protein
MAFQYRWFIIVPKPFEETEIRVASPEARMVNGIPSILP